MFEDHSSFLPVDPHASVWRYMDFTKFVSLIATRALWFIKAIELGDPWESAFTRFNRDRTIARLTGPDGRVADEALRNYRATLASMYVSCWHMSPMESAAMWRLYLTSLEGVAIQSAWGELTASIGNTRDPVHGGRVRYIDFEKDVTEDATNLFFPLTTKRLSFEHEREVRLVTWWRPDRSRGVPDYEQVPEHAGVQVPVNLDLAVRRVVLCPGSSRWFKELVRSVASKYEFVAPIEDSSMDAEPTHL